MNSTTSPDLRALDLSETANCACFNVRKTARSITQYYASFLANSPLKETQFSILSVLTQTEPLPIGKLAEILLMERTTLTRNLKPLILRDFISISPGKDKRSRLVSLTNTGSKAFAETLPQWQKAQKNLIAKFGKVKWALLRKQLTTLQSLTIDPM
ncbi:MAG: winged helix-turn-helix transcriptional regulator [Magnetovibrio sp.]|nr:winged helix-turn-helix transcriptional regulator [Magnetovibrio sp.]